MTSFKIKTIKLTQNNMSWDILIINSKEPVDFEKGDWSDFVSRQNVIENIKSTFPEVNWTDFSWGELTNEFADIEFNIGDEESIGNNFMLHVRGGSNVVNLIFSMCQQCGWIAYDLASEKFINSAEDNSGLKSLQDYKNQVIKFENTKVKKPWWKF